MPILEEHRNQPKAPNATRDDSGVYRWAGIDYPSVTKVLGLISGEHLMVWYAKMAATECADIVARAQSGQITRDDAYEQILDWNTRKTSAIRYRDHKGRIGTLTHHYLYERAMGIEIKDVPQWAALSVESLGLAKHAGSGDGYGALLASQSLAYIESAEGFLNTFKPEFEMIGLEAMVVHTIHGYAGRMDAIMRFLKSKWPADLPWPWKEMTAVRATGDFKTSKSIDKKYVLQAETYRHAEFIGLVEDGSEHQVEMTDGCAIIHITPDTGAHLLTYEPNEEFYHAFVSLRHVFGVLEGMPAPARVKQIAKDRSEKK